MINEYRKLKRACVIFGILIILFNCTTWGVEPIALLLVEILFLIYLIRWLESSGPKDTKKMLFFCAFLIGTTFGRLINDIVFKFFMTCFTILFSMLYLYSIRIKITLDRRSVLHFFSAALYWPFAYVYDFLQRENYTVQQQKRQQRVINGLFFAGIIAAIILVPLYMAGDNVFASWIILFVGWISDNIFYFALAIGFCWVPAMLIFSYIKGIYENQMMPSQQKQEYHSFDVQNMFFNKFSITAVFISCSIVNILFAVTQLAYILDVNLENNDITNKGNMLAIFMAIGINVIVVIVLAIMIHVKKIYVEQVRIASLSMIYAVSVILASVGFIWRYIAAVITYGLKGIWPIWGVALLILLSILACNIVNILYNYVRFVKILCYGAVILFLIFNISIPEYWIGKINIKIFDYKYRNSMLKNISSDIGENDISKIIIDKQDLDIAYISTLQLWAVPALVDVIEVENPYEETGKSVGETAKGALIDILSEELSENEKRNIKNNNMDEQLQDIIAYLEKQPGYRLPGKKMVIIQMLKDI